MGGRGEWDSRREYEVRRNASLAKRKGNLAKNNNGGGECRRHDRRAEQDTNGNVVSIEKETT